MIKEKNEETGEVKVIFSSEEFKKLKIFGGAAAVLLILSISLAGWAGYSTNALHAENELYRSQLKMADEKMQALENKAKTVEKISGQLQELVRRTAEQYLKIREWEPAVSEVLPLFLI